MESFIQKYNKEVEARCNEKMNKKKQLEKKSILSKNTKFDKNLNAFISQPVITKNQFEKIVKSTYTYLGKPIPTEPVLEDLYSRLFDVLSIDEFDEVMNLFIEKGYTDLKDAWNEYTRKPQNVDVLRRIDIEEVNMPDEDDSLRQRGDDLLQEIDSDLEEEEPTFSNIYPRLGTERDYGFAPSSRTQEMTTTRRDEAERIRRSEEVLQTSGRPVSMANIFSAERGRPRETIIAPLSGIIERPQEP